MSRMSMDNLGNMGTLMTYLMQSIKKIMGMVDQEAKDLLLVEFADQVKEIIAELQAEQSTGQHQSITSLASGCKWNFCSLFWGMFAKKTSPAEKISNLGKRNIDEFLSQATSTTNEATDPHPSCGYLTSCPCCGIALKHDASAPTQRRFSAPHAGSSPKSPAKPGLESLKEVLASDQIVDDAKASSKPLFLRQITPSHRKRLRNFRFGWFWGNHSSVNFCDSACPILNV
jgi:hypothetical protein